MGREHHLSPGDADAGRKRHGTVPAGGAVGPEDFSSRGGGDPTAHHRRRDGRSGRHDPVARAPDGLPQFPGRAVPVAERPRGERAADPRPAGEAGRLRHQANLGRSRG